MTTQRLHYFNNQELPAWVVDDLKDDTGTQYDMSSGWTFTVTLARTTAPATALAIKSTGITASATAITVAWSASDWSGLEAAVNGTQYVVLLQAVRTSDSYSIAYRPNNPPTLQLKAAPGTSAVSPNSYPITVTAASVTVADAGGYYTGDDVEEVLAELPTTWKHKQSRAFMRGVGLNDRPATVIVMGDSTGNDTTEWVYLLATWFASKFPAFTVDHRLWDVTAQGWGALTRLQTGTAGEAHLVTDGTNNRFFSCPDSATVSLTGDLSVRVKFQPDGSWVSGGDRGLFNKFGSAGNRSWRFTLSSTGTLVLEHSSDGTALKSKASTVIVPFASGEAGWIRADLDVDNGAAGYNVLFYTSTNGTDWTQLGTTVTTATASSVFDSTYDVGVGSRSGVEIAPAGKLYAAELYSGIGANPVLAASWRAGEMWKSGTSGNTTGYDVAGNLWSGNTTATTQGITGAPVITFRNASVSGVALSYFTDVTRFAKINTGRPRLTFTSLSHNEGGAYVNGGDVYYTAFSSFVSQITTNSAAGAVVIVGQNPKASPETTSAIGLHRDRIRALCELAAVGDHGFVDAYAALSDTATYVGADGIHPTAAGSTLWAETTERFLLNA